LRCAIYTRKSSEEGLDQAFNSLDAQREACESYIASQRHEGWRLVPCRYDDGGLSGGTLERPALQQLLADIDAGQIDLVVVYKIDRLTRALADFAKLVERFDAASCSFVSVTQAFNTSTSMGRLTLNVLLSFAQFEREVTAERIRDKISASKKKGYWMGGFTPLGYGPHPDPQVRSLVIQPDEAAIVRGVFELYDQLGCARLVEAEALRRGYRTKLRMRGDGRSTGGLPLRCGHIHFLLRNPVYVGRIRHKAEVHDGIHPPLVDLDLWDRVQAKLDLRNTHNRRSRSSEPPSLIGKLSDETGDRLTPSHAKKGTRRYRYYVSSRLLSARSKITDGWRLPAKPLEQQVAAAIAAHLTLSAAHLLTAPTPAKLERVQTRLPQISLPDRVSGVLESCRIEPGRLVLELSGKALAEGLEVDVDDLASARLKLEATFRVRRRGVESRLVIGVGTPRLDEKLIRAIAIAYAWLEDVRAGLSLSDIAKRQNCTPAFIRQRLQLAFLSPAIVTRILVGRQPPELTLTNLVAKGFPSDWDEQWQELGFAAEA
jgi:DNA invertase Pin-like site-specific DNA recombinase